MTDPEKPTSLNDFDSRLQAARERRDAAQGKQREAAGGGLGLAMRIAVELVAALAVGVAIGWGLDRWLGTKPWLLILFFVLGSAAGIMNVFRAVGGFDYGAGYHRHDGYHRQDKDGGPKPEPGHGGQGEEPDGDQRRP